MFRLATAGEIAQRKYVDRVINYQINYLIQ
jgi:hypothetical protein